MVGDVCFPVFVRARDNKRVKRFDSRDDLQRYLEPIDVENDEYEGWDNQGFRIVLLLANPKSIQSLEVERSSDCAMKDEALRALADFAAAEGASFSLPPQTEDILAVYEVLKHDVQLVWKKKPWLKRMLDRF